MIRKVSAIKTARVQPPAGESSRKETLEGIQRDLDGLLQLQQFQDRLLAEIRRRLVSIRNRPS